MCSSDLRTLSSMPNQKDILHLSHLLNSLKKHYQYTKSVFSRQIVCEDLSYIFFLVRHCHIALPDKSAGLHNQFFLHTNSLPQSSDGTALSHRHTAPYRHQVCGTETKRHHTGYEHTAFYCRFPDTKYPLPQTCVYQAVCLSPAPLQHPCYQNVPSIQ